MNSKTTISTILIAFIFIISHSAQACSMYKITADGKTMVGCNEDAWRTTSSIWFENATGENQYGACFTGSRKVGANRYAPQSGMNEVGLVFSRLTSYHPKMDVDQTGKKTITDEVQYLSEILHTCKTIDEVKRFIEEYNHSIFIDDVYIYVDRSGDYLVVEPYKLIKGNDPSYVLSNFCPSLTNNETARKQLRYKDGEDYLKENRVNTSLEYCRSMSDAMHVSRSRNGDGTLLTSIWNTQDGLVNLYFYHDYESTMQFNLSEELALGNHLISIPEIFPENPQYQRLIDYKTPFNVQSLRLYMAIAGVLMFLLAILYLISYIRRRKTDTINMIKLIFTALNVILFGYLFTLATNIQIFYFDAPYRHYNSSLISISSYTPFLLLLFIVPLTFYNLHYAKSNSKRVLIKSLLVFNNILYFILIIGFGYWGLFDVL